MSTHNTKEVPHAPSKLRLVELGVSPSGLRPRSDVEGAIRRMRREPLRLPIGQKLVTLRWRR